MAGKKIRYPFFLFVAGMLLSALLLAACGGRQEAATPEITIAAREYAFEIQAQVDAGLTSFRLQNNGQAPHHAQLVRLNDDVSLDAFQAALQESPDSIFGMIQFTGGPGVTAPGATSPAVTVDLAPGQYVILDFLPDEAGVPGLAKGMVAPFEVAATETQTAVATPQAAETIQLADFRFEMPESLPTGQVWQISNNGPQPHEMAIIRLAEGKSLNDVTAFLQAPEGAPPFEDAGGVQGINPGKTAWLNADFEPGTYVALCFIPDPATGKDHASLGMVQQFTIK